MAQSSLKLKKAVISYCLNWLVLLNNDLSDHPMVNGTEVRVSSRCREGVGEALPRLQYRRLLELVVGTRHRVGHVVVVSPGDRAPHRYGDSWRRKIKVIDDNFSLCSFGRN